jgi:hypothetical protein
MMIGWFLRGKVTMTLEQFHPSNSSVAPKNATWEVSRHEVVWRFNVVGRWEGSEASEEMWMYALELWKRKRWKSFSVFNKNKEHDMWQKHMRMINRTNSSCSKSVNLCSNIYSGECVYRGYEIIESEVYML